MAMKGVVSCRVGAMFGKGTYFGDNSGKIDQVQNDYQFCVKILICFFIDVFLFHIATHLSVMPSCQASTHGVALRGPAKDKSRQ